MTTLSVCEVCYCLHVPLHYNIELAEMDVQREEVQKLEKELYEAEETLEQERAKSKGIYSMNSVYL